MSGIIDILLRLRNRNEIPSDFIDVGAHFGETYEAMKAVFPNTNVISFEANPNCAEILHNKGINYQICLLGRKHKPGVEFLLDKNNPTSTGSSMYKELTTSYFEDAQKIVLPMYRLDDMVHANPEGSRNVFLKIDVQGAELDVLDGATELLPYVRWVYLEVSFVPCNESCPLFGEVAEKMYSLGYHVSDIGDPTYINDQLIQSNFLFVRT